MQHFNKGRKQKPEHIVKRTAAVRLAMQHPEVKAKMSGRVCSPETRAKIGLANSINMRGKKISKKHREAMRQGILKSWAKRKADPVYMAQHREKLSKALKGKYTGEQASNWRGGLWDGQRESNANWRWRELVLQRDNYTCQVCLQYGGQLHVDHIKKWSKYPELRFELSNGRVLCRACHYYIEFKKKLPKSSRWGLPGQLQKHKTKLN